MTPASVTDPSRAPDSAATPAATQKSTVVQDSVTTERWALCGECDRWFYCERGCEETMSTPTCPVCGTPPLTVADRAMASGGSLGPEAGIA